MASYIIFFPVRRIAEISSTTELGKIILTHTLNMPWLYCTVIQVSGLMVDRRNHSARRT